VSVLNVMQLEVGGEVGVGTGVETLVGMMCGVGVGTAVSMRLGIDGMGIEVGVGEGRWRLWLSESLASEPDEEERVGDPVAHAASKTINARHNRLQKIFFTDNTFPWFQFPFMLKDMDSVACAKRVHAWTTINLVLMEGYEVKV
jgi:hypothetical protein